MLSQEVSDLYSELKNKTIEVKTKAGTLMVGQWISIQWNYVTAECRVVLSSKDMMSHIPAHSIQSITNIKNEN